MRRRLPLDDLLGQVDRIVHRDGEPDAGIVAGVGRDQRVDADELAVLVDERAAGIAGVDGCVSLDHVGVDRRGVRLLLAVLVRVGRVVHDLRAVRSRHDARRHRLLKAEGAADRHDPFAHRQIVGITQLHGSQPRSVLRLDDRDVGAGVGANDVRIVFLALDGDLQGVGALDHVIVRHDVAIGRKHHAAAERRLSKGILRAVAVIAALLVGVHVDSHHGRKALLGDAFRKRRILIGIAARGCGRRAAKHRGRARRRAARHRVDNAGAAEHEHACKRRARKRDPERLRTRMVLLRLWVLLRSVRLRVMRTCRLRIGRRGIDGRRGIRPRHTTRTRALVMIVRIRGDRRAARPLPERLAG